MQLPFELDALAEARNYQRWVFDAVRPFLGRRILEVGSGIGNMSQWLPADDLLVLTETEPMLLDLLRERVPQYFGPLAGHVRIEPLSLGAAGPSAIAVLNALDLDTVISFNVLEHIEDDRDALGRLIGLLRGGSARERRLVSFVPAQSWALSDLDRYYGHFRRYSKQRIHDLSRELAPDAELSVTPFNALGLLGWVWSTMIRKQTTIDRRAVSAYDALCRYTRHVDDFACRRLRYPLGQSFVWVLTLR
ncbi:MAG TPA: class I SAM-dependent methyltransferase [Vicinamibacterales bacterium]|jgi:SAM-dependent methyltransferase